MEFIARQVPGPRVLDVGSMLAEPGQMTYKTIADELGWKYVGLDMAPGYNVDVVATDPYKFPIESDSFDVVISGQTFEHIEFPWLTIKEIARVMRPGGIAIITAPGSGPEHRYPKDCWRYYPDGMRALAKWADLTCLHASTPWHEAQIFLWADTFGVFQKAGGPVPQIDFSGLRKIQLGSKVRERFIDVALMFQHTHRKLGKLARLF
jgi:SAM-dependent methyltransferase